MPMHVGIVYVAYNTEDLVQASLSPWIEAKRARLGGHSYTICAVSVPFTGFSHTGPRDQTQALLAAKADLGSLDHAIISDKPLPETAARGAALSWLVTRGVHLTIMVDSDEFWTAAQIEDAFAFVEANPWVVWFRVPYRQIVFTPDQYLAEPFTPPRIHRVHIPGGYRATGFWDDNGVYYQRAWEDAQAGAIHDVNLSNLTIPREQVWVRHATWLSNERSRAKVAYQNSRPGWRCDFDWDDSRGGLIWRDGITPKETLRDVS